MAIQAGEDDGSSQGPPVLEGPEMHGTSRMVPIMGIPACFLLASPAEEESESCYGMDENDEEASLGEQGPAAAGAAAEEEEEEEEVAPVSRSRGGAVSLQDFLAATPLPRTTQVEESPPPPPEAPPPPPPAVPEAREKPPWEEGEPLGLEVWRERCARLARDLELAHALTESQRAQLREIQERVGSLEAEVELGRRREARAVERAHDADVRCARAEDEVAKLRAEVAVWRDEHASVSTALEATSRDLAALRRRGDADQRPVASTSLADWARTAPLRPRNDREDASDAHLRKGASSLADYRGTAPFATEDDDVARLGRRQPLERDLVKINVERDKLLAEYARLPNNPRTQAQRDRRDLAERRLDQLQFEADFLKSKIKEAAA